jgi:NAD(P)-dependent dehydrogenase (short-subunit alcohol dehydrogenase family)
MDGLFAPDLFTGKVILVTGAGGGVGGATARLLHKLGATVAATDLHAESLTDLPAALHLPADLREVSACETLVQTTLARFGRIDAVVAAAGIWVEGPSDQATEADWSACIDVNLKGTFFLISRAIPALAETKGAVVAIASDAGIVGNAGAAIYCASKGGVVLMVRALARELAPKGIRVNALCPSDIDSPMLAHQATRFGDGDPQAYLARLRSNYPQGEASRFLTTEEIAAQVAFLLSPASAGVTGASVMVDFGLTAGY